MVNKLLWKPSNTSTLLTDYIKFLKKNNLHYYQNYSNLHNWSIEKKEIFWKSIWDFTNIVGEYNDPVIINENDFINSKFFVNSKLNYAKNIIKKNNHDSAIVFYSEQNHYRKISWSDLKINVNKFANYLKKQGIKKGDRIGAVLPNIPEAVIAFLGSAKIGAIWSSCSADFGADAIIDRFEQIKPKILIVADYYYYNNKKIDTLAKVKELKNSISSIKKIIIIPYEAIYLKYETNFDYENWLSIISDNDELFEDEIFEFNTPLYILYSSGTTGQPKCIVHGAGGSLLQHKKEHQLHCNMTPNSKVFYFTTCGWMMWNWLVSCLASESTILLYDGSPFFPETDFLFNIIEKEKITHFGTGAKYLDALKQEKLSINDKFNLEFLKTILSTGSPLSPESFEYIYSHIKKNLHLASICGGTDIVSCFIAGNPNAPVYSGEIQSRCLGMDVEIFDPSGKKINEQKGELVCLSTFVSKPIYFWKDIDNKEFKKTYFSKYPDTWYQGDYVEVTKRDGFIVHGRSDATLNSGGVRIGTAELYRVVEKIENINECVAVEQRFENDTRIILFIKLKKFSKLNTAFIELIKNKIRHSLSPKHIPSKILQVSDIPKTKSGKIVELTIKKLIHNEKIVNLNSLVNPESLNEFKNRKELEN